MWCMRAYARARQPATQVGGPITACALGGWAVGRTQLEAMADEYPNWTWTIDASYATEHDATTAALDGRRAARSSGGDLPPRHSGARVAPCILASAACDDLCHVEPVRRCDVVLFGGELSGGQLVVIDRVEVPTHRHTSTAHT